ncbi:bifunctional acetate--CoA ligase family protein/GNAT family N-acetyltransferase [Roseimaritima sediminicola]|uniref:bifunctional acetate--CoA ligase family protein/GNAT family N-acetyltransferase n=1 Tax=Roseimaritima sediminicola TaxID=2662066 RepID=UPI00129827C2|nr:bifunctional acetate--CoA ligase family protein/GNAT family N-acetyltransferase [Roseimaritima sediminicola]
MPIRNLNKIFAPRSVAVIGASRRDGSVGSTVLENLIGGGFAGAVYRVNPKYTELDGEPCYRCVDELSEPVDLAIVCTPAETVPEIVRQCGRVGIRGLVILSAGFREVSEEGKELEAEVRAAMKPFEGMRVVGPNSLGIMAPHLALNASFASDPPLKGNVAFISQSGALCTAILDWALQENVGFSHFVSVGNMVDVGIADLIDYFAGDNRTESIILYVESIDEARHFMSAARSFTRTKPIIAYKAGRFAESAKAAASHTGAMAGVDAVYEAAMARAGIVRVFEIDDLFDCAELLARQKMPSGPRLAIVTNAGGPGVMAADALLERQGVLAELSGLTLQKLNRELPAAWSRGNPVDVLGDASPDRFAVAARVALTDPGVDAVLVVLSPQAMTNPTGVAKAIVEVERRSPKPVLAAWMGGGKVREGIETLNNAGIATYSSPEKAVRAFMHLVAYARNRETLYETPREVPLEFPLDRQRLRDEFGTLLREGQGTLNETTSKALLEAYEIPVTQTLVARSAEEVLECADRVGYPVVLKIISPDITHKTDVGGVELNLTSAAEATQAYQRILQRAKQKRPDARREGVTVQRMLVAPTGHELIIGAKRDPVFGTVLLVGAGGTNAELLRDRALELPPLTERLARRMLESLRAWPLLQGYRGRPGVNLDRLIEALMRLSYLVADFPEIVELDVNPLLATPETAIALDARIVLEPETVTPLVRPYSHLAIRPYPDELSRHSELKDGTSVRLRPIKPEDEPMWHGLIASCSLESLHLRFRYMFKSVSHEMATRFCFVDYDREIAIVAEIGLGSERKIIGIGRLIADVDHHEAEYAILVGDPWQGGGLGSLLTEHCLEIAQQWGVRSVIAEIAPENTRMIRIFKRLDFAIDRRHARDVVIARKSLAEKPST